MIHTLLQCTYRAVGVGPVSPAMAAPVCSFWGCGIVCTFAFACLQYDIIIVAIACAYHESSAPGRRVFQAAISQTRTNLLPTALTYYVPHVWRHIHNNEILVIDNS